MSDILLEVDDELRSQQIKALWQKYGQTVISLALVIVIASAVGVFWHDYKNSKLEKDTDVLLSIMDADKSDPKALADLANKATAPLDNVVALQLAQKQEAAGKLKDARDSYSALSKNASGITRDLATYHAVRLGMILKEDPKGLLKKIEPLTDVKNAYHGSALELKGLLLKQLGNNKEANATFKAMTDDVSVPNSLRQRAHMYIDYGSANAQ